MTVCTAVTPFFSSPRSLTPDFGNCAQEANAFGVALFESLGKALSRQRATLGNIDDFEFLRFFDTTAKRTGREEALEAIMGALAAS